MPRLAPQGLEAHREGVTRPVPIPLAFSLILTVASRLLHPYSTDDKASRLMVKQFSTLRDHLSHQGSLRGGVPHSSDYKRQEDKSRAFSIVGLVE